MNPNPQIRHKNAGSNPEHIVRRSNKTGRFQKTQEILPDFMERAQVTTEEFAISIYTNYRSKNQRLLT
ncbi:MAG: hypothetical protein MKZ59_08890 [Deinococcales bacterium]|nr:hypothetical protein [Deinococcales bacterium]